MNGTDFGKKYGFRPLIFPHVIKVQLWRVYERHRVFLLTQQWKRNKTSLAQLPRLSNLSMERVWRAWVQRRLWSYAVTLTVFMNEVRQTTRENWNLFETPALLCWFKTKGDALVFLDSCGPLHPPEGSLCPSLFSSLLSVLKPFLENCPVGSFLTTCVPSSWVCFCFHLFCFLDHCW